MDTITKRCPACMDTKPVSEFYINKQRNQPAGYCKICANRKRVADARIARAKLPKTNGYFALSQDTRDRVKKLMGEGESITSISQTCGITRARLYYYKSKGYI